MTIGIIKVSILFFYLRVFPRRYFRIQCWLVLGFCLITTVVFALVSVFQCQPVSYVWNKDVRPGKCLNYNTVAWFHAGMNILQDIIIVVLPIQELRTLQLSFRKRLGLYAMFGVGSMLVTLPYIHSGLRRLFRQRIFADLNDSVSVCVLSMVRLNSLKTFGLTADPTWDNVPTTFWSTLETTTAFVAACMPALRAGFVNLFQKAAGLTTGKSSKSNPTGLSAYANRRSRGPMVTAEWSEITVTHETNIWSDTEDAKSVYPSSSNRSLVSRRATGKVTKPSPINIPRAQSAFFGTSKIPGSIPTIATRPATSDGHFHLRLKPLPNTSPKFLHGLRLPSTATFRQLNKSLPPSPFSMRTISPTKSSLL